MVALLKRLKIDRFIDDHPKLEKEEERARYGLAGAPITFEVTTKSGVTRRVQVGENPQFETNALLVAVDGIIVEVPRWLRKELQQSATTLGNRTISWFNHEDVSWVDVQLGTKTMSFERKGKNGEWSYTIANAPPVKTWKLKRPVALLLKAQSKRNAHAKTNTRRTFEMASGPAL